MTMALKRYASAMRFYKTLLSENMLENTIYLSTIGNTLDSNAIGIEVQILGFGKLDIGS